MATSMTFKISSHRKAIQKLTLFEQLVDNAPVKMFVRGTMLDASGNHAFMRDWRKVEHISDIRGFCVEIDGGREYLKPKNHANIPEMFEFMIEVVNGE